eukprot:TRINITY_DN1461_c0_g1_i2.p1 TRINITY_DN1461_c0_g1~~TRINITY_DN1461_c0_g1_i2.p1  ORF type:complete len:221 (-),score=40.00 TRINITY_DN1461_c0_g1_i2:91-753(-)
MQVVMCSSLPSNANSSPLLDCNKTLCPSFNLNKVLAPLNSQFHQTRRNLISKPLLYGLSTLLTLAISPASATALPLGFSGPKEWLKQQKKKTANFLLAPISVSRDYLANAYNILKQRGSIDLKTPEGQKAQSLVKSAARDCIPPENGSFVAFQASTGVEICTFRLILKNAASLLKDSDPIKLKADVAFDDLMRKQLGGAFELTMTTLDKFETSIKECLGI